MDMLGVSKNEQPMLIQKLSNNFKRLDWALGALRKAVMIERDTQNELLMLEQQQEMVKSSNQLSGALLSAAESFERSATRIAKSFSTLGGLEKNFLDSFWTSISRK